MTDGDIARLRGLAQAATPGPWEAAETPSGKGKVLRGGGFSVCNTTAGPYTQQRADAAYIAAASPDVLLRMLDEIDALRRERDEAQRDARELRFLWEQRGERANKAEDERDAAMALLRECDEVATSLCGVAGLVEHGDLFARIDAMLSNDKGA